MAELVEKNFKDYFPDPTPDESRIPTFNEIQPVLQLLLDYLAKEKLSYQRNSVQEVFRKVNLQKISQLNMNYVFVQLFNTINDINLMNGLHEMLTNMISAVILDPKESLNHHVCLAFLGTTSDALKIKCNWSNEAYASAVKAFKQKPGPFGGGLEAFIHKFYDPKDKKTGPYLRMMVSDMASLSLDSSSFEKTLNSSLLDVSHKFFNYQDSIIAVVASELVDLHNNDRGMTNFDAFTEASLRLVF